jgi:hypothetical protein
MDYMADPTSSFRSRLRRWDFVIIPGLAVLTLLVPALVGEGFARLAWPEVKTNSCFVGVQQFHRFRPNCVTRMKVAEGEWVEYHYNECGLRASDSCGPKPLGVERIAILGTSVGLGFHVAENDLFSAKIRPDLERIWNRKVQIENFSSVGPPISQGYKLDPQILKVSPDVVMLVLVPYDLIHMLQGSAQADDGRAEMPATAGWLQTPLLKDFQVGIRDSRLLLVVRHFVWSDEFFSLRAYVDRASPDDASRIPLSSTTRHAYDLLEAVLVKFADDFHAHHVRLLVVAFPNRSQAIAIAHGVETPALDPSGFPHRVAEIAKKAGVEFVDVVPAIKRSAATVNDMFYPVDGHPTRAAHQLIAESLVAYFHEHPYAGEPKQ